MRDGDLTTYQGTIQVSNRSNEYFNYILLLTPMVVFTQEWDVEDNDLVYVRWRGLRRRYKASAIETSTDPLT